jgi:hypothetical protein
LGGIFILDALVGTEEKSDSVNKKLKIIANEINSARTIAIETNVNVNVVAKTVGEANLQAIKAEVIAREAAADVQRTRDRIRVMRDVGLVDHSPMLVPWHTTALLLTASDISHEYFVHRWRCRAMSVIMHDGANQP